MEFKAKLRKALQESVRSGNKVSELVKHSLEFEQGVTILELAGEMYRKDGAQGNQKLDSLQKAVKRVSKSKENELPSVRLKLVDRKSGEYTFIAQAEIKQKTTIEKILALVEAKDCDLTNEQLKVLGTAIADMEQLETAKA